MKWLKRLRSLVRIAFHRNHFEKEMAEEMRFHLDESTRNLVQSGVPEVEARRQARIAFGGMEKAKEECRHAWTFQFVAELLQDVRHGFRLLMRNRGFAFVAVLVLAAGVCASATIFTFVN